MHATSIILTLVLATSPLIAGLPVAPAELERRYYGGNANLAAMIARVFPTLATRHPTESQITTKKARTLDLAIDDALEDQEDLDDEEDAAAFQTRDIAADVAVEDQEDLEDEEGANLEAHGLAADEAPEDPEDEESGAVKAREPLHTGIQDPVKKARANTLESLYVSGGGI